MILCLSKDNEAKRYGINLWNLKTEKQYLALSLIYRMFWIYMYVYVYVYGLYMYMYMYGIYKSLKINSK